jgi:hypothetical protein
MNDIHNQACAASPFVLDVSLDGRPETVLDSGEKYPSALKTVAGGVAGRGIRCKRPYLILAYPYGERGYIPNSTSY